MPRKSQHMSFSPCKLYDVINPCAAQGINHLGRRCVRVTGEEGQVEDVGESATWKLIPGDTEFLYIGKIRSLRIQIWDMNYNMKFHMAPSGTPCVESDPFFRRFALRFISDFKVSVH